MQAIASGDRAGGGGSRCRLTRPRRFCNAVALRANTWHPGGSKPSSQGATRWNSSAAPSGRHPLGYALDACRCGQPTL